MNLTKDLKEIIENLKHDANNILSFMASNGLVANAGKTVFMILNLTKKECESELTKELTIDGATIPRSEATKLLGIKIDDKHNWKEHFSGTNGLISALNKRTFTIRRIRNQLPKKEVKKVVQSLWMAKLRYGLQLCNQVRLKPEDSENQNMKAAQIAQNKMLRMLDGVSLKEHITSSSLLTKYGLPSVNQLAGEIKLVEAWKSIKVPNYPFQMEESNPNRLSERIVRESTTKKWKDSANCKAARESIGIECARLWNNAPISVKNAPTLAGAKREIKIFCKSMEI